MDLESRNIIIAMESGSIFSVSVVDRQIRSEVPFFKNLLISNINNHEVFHGYINKIIETWGVILKEEFKKLILIYNVAYVNYKNIQYNREQEMIRMASEIDAELLHKEFSKLNAPPNVKSLGVSMSKSSISSKKPSKRNPSKFIKKSPGISSMKKEFSDLDLGRKHKTTPYSRFGKSSK